MKKSRFFAGLLCLCMVFSLAACGGPVEGEPPVSDGPGTQEPGETPERPEGTLTIEDVYVWKDYPAVEFFPVFSVASEAEPLTYEYDETLIAVDGENNLISCVADATGRTTVTARSENFSAEFTVYYEVLDKSGDRYDTSDYTAYASSLAMLCSLNGTSGRTTVFLGDSFFDTRYFWTNFSTYYQGMDALCCGISSTTSYDWETLASAVLGDLVPANIAIHVGTNNVYDDEMDLFETTYALQRLFLVLHDLYPETNIYYFGITQRAYDGDKINTVTRVNENMQAWCAQRDWIVWLDTPSKITADMLKDQIHPMLEYYSVFVNALEEANMPLYLK